MDDEPVNNVVMLAERARTPKPSALDKLVAAQQALVTDIVERALAAERAETFKEIAALRRELEQLRTLVEAERGGQIVCMQTTKR